MVVVHPMVNEKYHLTGPTCIQWLMTGCSVSVLKSITVYLDELQTELIPVKIKVSRKSTL